MVRRSLELPLDAVGLRLRVERCTRSRSCTSGTGLVGSSLHGASRAAAAVLAAVVRRLRAPRRVRAEATLPARRAGAARPLRGRAAAASAMPPGASSLLMASAGRRRRGRRAPSARCDGRGLRRRGHDLGARRVRRSAWAAAAAWAWPSSSRPVTATEMARRRSSPLLPRPRPGRPPARRGAPRRR